MEKKKKLLEKAIVYIHKLHWILTELEGLENKKRRVAAIQGADVSLAHAVNDLFYLEKEYANKSK